MTLKGWLNSLPEWIVEAVNLGLYTIHYEAKGDFEYLKGKAINPHTGIVIEFQ